jgi:hypothetical protein
VQRYVSREDVLVRYDDGDVLLWGGEFVCTIYLTLTCVMHARRLGGSRVFTARHCGALTVLHYRTICYNYITFFRL